MQRLVRPLHEPLVPALPFIRGGTGAPPAERLAATRGNVWRNSFSSSTYYTMARSTHVATTNITALRLAYLNLTLPSNNGREVGNDASRTVRASIEYNGTVKQITFTANQTGGDATTGTISSVPSSGATSSGGLMISDMVTLGFTIPEGATFFVRTYTVGSSLSYIDTGKITATDCLNAATSSGSAPDLTGSTGAFSSNAGAGSWCGPAAIIASSAKPSVFALGDSQTYGLGDLMLTDGRAGVTLKTATMPLATFNGGTPSNRAQAGIAGWIELAPNRSLLIPYAATVVNQLGFNDLATGQTAAATVARATYYAQNVFPSAAKKFLCTTLPYSSSTDGWATTGSQTPNNTTQRGLYNDAVRAGVAGYDGYFDLAAALETTQNSNLWKTGANYRAVTDASMTTGASSTTLNSASANFTSADIGYGVAVVGAGAAGALLLGYIVSVTSATAVVLSTGCSTTVTGATARVGTLTLDGAHPTPAAYTLAAGQVNSALFV